MRTPRISLVAMEARDPGKAFVRIPNEPGRWVLTDRCVVEMECPVCMAAIGEPCHNRRGKYGVGTHAYRRINYNHARGAKPATPHIEDEDAKPRMRIPAIVGRVRRKPAWKQLAELMSDISEQCWCAGWMMGTEFALWEVLTSPHRGRHLGKGEVTLDQLVKLRALSEEAGGWIYWNDETEETFIPMDEWMKQYQKYN